MQAFFLFPTSLKKSIVTALLGVTFLVQLQGTQAQELPLGTSTTRLCSVNRNTYTEAEVTKARAELEVRRTVLRRVQDLAKAGVVPPSELDEAVYQERLARIGLELAQTASSPRAQVTEAEAKAQVAEAQAELELRRVQLQRSQRLADEGAIPRSELLEALQEERNARANLEKAQACLRELRQ